MFLREHHHQRERRGLMAAPASFAERKFIAMNIVVVKSPKFLNGILKRIFKMKE